MLAGLEILGGDWRALLARVEQAVSGAAPDALRLYCREIEHDEENLDALRAAFQPDGLLPPAAFLRTLTV